MKVLSKCTRQFVIAAYALLVLIPTVLGQIVRTNSSLFAYRYVQNFTSPGYPGSYPSNMDCEWVIASDGPSRVVMLTLVDFMLESALSCQYDYVLIYDGIGTSSPILQERLCGSVVYKQFTSSGHYLTVAFHSDQSNTNAGFNFEYTSIEKPVCSHSSLVADASARYLTSSGYPTNYPSNIDCHWYISTNAFSNVVLLKLLDFSLVESSLSHCNTDYVAIYDGYGTDYPEIAKLCGTLSSRQFTNTGQYMTVVFHSDATDNLRGFKFEYTSQHKSVVCANSSLFAYAYVQNLTSPGYPNNYPSNMDCQWVITSDGYSRVVVLKLVNFLLENSSQCQFDYVSIYDGNGTSSPKIQTLCGSSPYRQFTSTGRYMTVVFHSDRSNNCTGFKFEYTSKDKLATCSNSSLSASTSAQTITSPGYPYNYSSNIECEWIITSASFSKVILLKVLNFQLEGSPPSCNYEYVSIYDGMSSNSPRIQKLCGELSLTEFTSSGSYMTVVFRSDGGTSRSGFRLEYSLQDELGLCVNNSLSASGSVAYITSPGYPYSYPGNVDCQWRITTDSLADVVELSVLDFYLESSISCINDYVYIYDGYSTFSPRIVRLCGVNSNTQYTSNGSYIFVVFHSDQSNNYRGFKFQYRSKPKPGLCSSSYLTASTRSQDLTSPNYPSPYPSNTDCQWHISSGSSANVVVLNLIQFSLEGYPSACYNDYVKIYDGTSTASKLLKVLCGSLYGDSFESTSSDLTVVFHSNERANYNSGFRFTYQSQNAKDPSPDTTGAIVAIVICSIVVPCIVVILIVVIRRRMAYKQARTRTTASRTPVRENSLFVVGNATRRSMLHSAPDMNTLDSPNTFDPPPYSSLNFDINDSLPSYTPRIPGYNINDLPPPYSPDLPASINNSPRPRKAGDGVSSTQDGGARINSAFSVSPSDDVSIGRMTDRALPAGVHCAGDTNVAVPTVIPTAPPSSFA